MIVPFARLPRREYIEEKERRPRIDISKFDDDRSEDSDTSRTAKTPITFQKSLLKIESMSAWSDPETFSSDSDKESVEDKDDTLDQEYEDCSSKDGESRMHSKISDYDDMNDDHSQSTLTKYKTVRNIENMPKFLSANDDIKSVHSINTAPSNRFYKKSKIISYLKRLKAFIRRRKWYIAFNAWRAKKGEKRRHHLLRYYEELIPMEEEKLKKEIANELFLIEK